MKWNMQNQMDFFSYDGLYDRKTVILSTEISSQRFLILIITLKI